MFVGDHAAETLEQMGRLIRLDGVKDVYVCASGTFRLEQVVGAVSPTVAIHSADVTLLAAAIGKLAVGGEPLAWRYTGDLVQYERDLEVWNDGAPATAFQRTASLLVAAVIGGFRGTSEHAELHRAHYTHNLRRYMPQAEKRLSTLLGALRLSSFAVEDWRMHAQRGVEAGAFVVCVPPVAAGGGLVTSMRGGANLTKFLEKNAEWTGAPLLEGGKGAGTKDVAPFVRALHDGGAAYLVACDEEIEGLKPVAYYKSQGSHSTFIYSRTEASSYIRKDRKVVTFAYQAVEIAGLRKKSKVQLVPTDTAAMNFLKERYLARGINHASGELNWLVYVDEKLAGAFSYRKSPIDTLETVYLLSDFSVSREGRIAKLIALIATSMEPMAVAGRKFLIKPKRLYTTVFTKKPISMKYRGVFEVDKRGTGADGVSFVTYQSAIRQQTPQEIYAEWWRKHGQPLVDEARRAERGAEQPIAGGGPSPGGGGGVRRGASSSVGVVDGGDGGAARERGSGPREAARREDGGAGEEGRREEEGRGGGDAGGARSADAGGGPPPHRDARGEAARVGDAPV